MNGSRNDENTDIAHIFKKYNELIYRYIYIRVNFNKAIAEDISQEVFLRVLKSIDSFDVSKSSLKNWIFTIARNLVIDFYRRKKPEPLSERALENNQPEDTDNEERILYREILEELSNLTEDEKDLITLYYIEDFSIDEISKIIGKKYTATKVSIYRALDKLKQRINGKNN